MMPSPYGRHRPRSIRPSASPERNSSTRRDLPAPADPSTVNSWQSRSETARSNACSSSTRSRVRPTIGASRWRVRIGESDATWRSRNASTGSALALQRRAARPARRRRHPGRDGRSARRSGSRRARPTIGDARRCSSCRRSAAGPRPTPRTSPVVSPMRRGHLDAPSPLRTPRGARRISTAARTARSASSSWTWGIPKTATTASPMNFSTRPPWRSTAARISSK